MSQHTMQDENPEMMEVMPSLNDNGQRRLFVDVDFTTPYGQRSEYDRALPDRLSVIVPAAADEGQAYYLAVNAFHQKFEPNDRKNLELVVYDPMQDQVVAFPGTSVWIDEGEMRAMLEWSHKFGRDVEREPMPELDAIGRTSSAPAPG